MKNYILMHKNDKVAVINIENNSIRVDNIINKNWMPFGIIESDNETIHEQITKWNGERCIPFGRPNYQKLMEECQTKCASDWIAKSYMCSLTDCYWFKPVDSGLKWEDVNFHQNGFSSNLYKHLFYGENNEPINHFNSPDITTDGAEPKMWTEKSDGFYLLKHYSDNEPTTVCNEFIVSKIFAKLGIDCVNYDLVEIKGKICCESKCFIDSDKEEFVPAADLMKQYGYTLKDVEQLMKTFGFEEEFNKMIIGDYLSGNSDRHARNFGIIIDSDSRQTKRFAPLFDHGETYIYENIDRAYYLVGETTFGKAMDTVDLKYFSALKDINQSDVANILNTVPYYDFDTKNEIFCEFFRRIEYLNDLVIERDVEHGREY